MDIDLLIKKLNLKEKVSLFTGEDNWRTKKVERLGIPELRMTDGPHGTRFIPENDQGSDSGLPATCFPTASAMAATWNTDLIQRVGVALGVETRAKGAHILLGPAVNIHRTPVGGRNFEYFSEDPYLAGRMAVAYINGVQSQGVGVSLKHYACNNSEFERMTISSEVGERALFEIYLPAFRAAVLEAHPWTVMCSYNKINGVYASENYHLLIEILKQAWGFDGFVVSDWGAVHDRVKSANGGLDLEMPGKPGEFQEDLFRAVRKKVVREEILDEKLKRIFQVMDKAGVFSQTVHPTHLTNTPEQQQIAFETASEAMVLLKNENQILPVIPKRVKSIGVFGYLAESPTIEGGGSSRVTPYYVTSPIEELKKRCQGMIEIYFEPMTSPEGTELDPDALKKAQKIAKKVDLAIIFAGYAELYEEEGIDRATMELPADQGILIKKIAEQNKNTVVILMNGAPVLMPWIDQVGAVLEAWYCGQESGRAIAAILMGEVNPSGKTPMTFPIRRIDHSDYLNYPGENGKVLYGEGIFVGYRYYDAKEVVPQFPFGYGLSYSTFQYENLTVDATGLVDGKKAKIEFQLKNLGKFDGKEVVQLYVHDPQSNLVRPQKELKGFRKTWLNAGEEKTVTLDLSLWDLAYYDPGESAWVAESGTYEIWIGSSSRDIHLKGRFDLAKTIYMNERGVSIHSEKQFRFSADSFIKDIMADEGAKAVMRKYLGNVEHDPRLALARRYTLRQVSMYAPGELPQDVVVKIDRELKLL